MQVDDELTRERAAEMQRWARLYAQNRTMGVVIALFLSLTVFGGVFQFSQMAGEAKRAGDWPAFAVLLVLLAIAVAGLVWISVPRWGGLAIRRVGENLYGNEGRLLLDPPPDQRLRRKMLWASVAFAVCVQLTVFGGRWVPPHLLQPLSALYAVPFFLFMARSMGRSAGFVPYVWPALYAVHAVLIVAGAPIVFSGRYEVLNVMFPVGVYGIAAALVGHVYSRYALKRLKEAVR
jgi:hypothetical protein